MEESIIHERKLNKLYAHNKYQNSILILKLPYAYKIRLFTKKIYQEHYNTNLVKTSLLVCHIC